MSAPHTHLEPVMGTVVGITSPDPLPPSAVAAAVEVLHEADRVFSTWRADSPLTQLRAAGAAIHELELDDALVIYEVLERCALAKQMTQGAFDPWALPGGLDPTGLVKGWAARRALAALRGDGVTTAMVNAGGDIAVSGGAWRIGIRHPDQADALVGVLEVSGAVATSGDYERAGQLVDPATGRTVRGGAATVTGPELDLADAIATGLSVAGPELLPVIDGLPGYEAYLVAADGRHFATPGLPLVPA